MAQYGGSVAAATAVVGYDLTTNEIWKTASNHRAVTGIALKGSAAAGDTQVDLMVGTVRVARLNNNNTGFPNMDDLMNLMAFDPAGAPISLIVVDAPATNPINYLVNVEDL